MPNVLGVLGSICLPSKSPSTVCLSVCSSPCACVRCALRVNVKVNVATVSQKAVWRRGPLIIGDRQADRQTYRQGSQADRQADGTAESADRPDRTGAGPTHTKGRRRSATPLERTNERKKERKKNTHAHYNNRAIPEACTQRISNRL